MNTDENKKKIIMLFIALGLILSVIFGVTFSYLAPSINNVESNSTVVFNAGTIAINYENGQNQINASEVLPGWTSIKEFSLTAINNTTISTAGAMNYAIKLIVEKNTFSDGAITYSIEGENVDNNGTVAYVLPNSLKNGASEVILGYGLFDTSSDISKGVTHNYTLTMAFPNKTYESQNENSGKTLSAHITITNEGESTFSNLTITDDNNNLNKTMILKNDTEYELPNIASKAGACFLGWNVESGNATINGNKITINGNATIKTLYGNCKTQEYAYIAPTTSNKEPYYTFTVPLSGKYRLETWGAQGGCSLYNNKQNCTKIGYGGYSTGEITLKKGDVLYIYVGGAGANGALKVNSAGGYNGGGLGTWDNNDDETSGGGGGATHIAKVSGLLSTLESNKDSIIMVSGGAGGQSASSLQAGSGGGFRGGISTVTNQSIVSQDTGYAFGKGQDASGTAASDGVGGGGGGFYGGYMNNVSSKSSGSGGSGYIGNSLLSNRAMYCHSCTESTEDETKTVTTTCHSSTPTENCAKEGNGYAKITMLEIKEVRNLSTITVVSEELKKVITIEAEKGEETNISISSLTNFSNEFKEFKLEKGSATIDGYNVTPTSDKVVLKVIYYVGQVNEFAFIEPTTDDSTPYYSFKAEKSGSYKLETWGAQGGGTLGGYGAYSIGSISLNKGEVLYVYVGGQGGSNSTTTNVGGYNGGGYSGNMNASDSYGGGGATHIALESGLLTNFSNKLDKLLIVSAGGGGASEILTTLAGSGGGITGCGGTSSHSQYNSAAYLPGGGTQTGAGFAYGGSARQGIFGAGIQSNTSGYGGGGGAGLYGGSNGHGTTGAGGSSYIGHSLLTNKAMYSYQCEESSEETTRTISTLCHSETPTINCAKEGNGYARITYFDY